MATPRPYVSVILPVFNNAAHIDDAVQSVLLQTDTSCECLIVDDGSTDGSLEKVLDWQAKHPEFIRVLRHPDGVNRGVAASRNLALQQAKGTYFAFLDSDDRWYPGKLSRQVSMMEQNPKLGLTYTRARILRDEEGQNFIPGTDILGHAPPRDRGMSLIGILNVSINYIFSTVMIRAELLGKIGRFDEDLVFQCEDRILVAKASALADINMVPEVLCDYRAHGESYTAHAIRTGIIPAIFFEMQSRVACWLASRSEAKSWARLVARRMMPENLVSALLCRPGQHERRMVIRDLTRVVRFVPSSIPFFLFSAIKHSRIGAMFRFSAWASRP